MTTLTRHIAARVDQRAAAALADKLTDVSTADTTITKATVIAAYATALGYHCRGMEDIPDAAMLHFLNSFTEMVRDAIEKQQVT